MDMTLTPQQQHDLPTRPDGRFIDLSAKWDRAEAILADAEAKLADVEGDEREELRELIQRARKDLAYTAEVWTWAERHAVNGPGERSASARFETYTPRTDLQTAAIAGVLGWNQHPGQPWCVLLTGETQSGKTHLAASHWARAVEQGRCRHTYIHEPTLYAKWLAAPTSGEGTTRGEWMERLSLVPRLYWDDFGKSAHGRSGFSHVLAEMIDIRHRHGRQTLVTTQLRGRDIAKVFGPGTWARLSEGLVLPIDRGEAGAG